MASTSLFRFQKALGLNSLSLSLYLSLPDPDGPGACSANMQVVRIPVPVYVRPPVVLLYKLYDIFLIMSIGARKNQENLFILQKKREETCLLF